MASAAATLAAAGAALRLAQQWRHKRSAADPGHSDQRANAEPRERIERVD
jgi:hypothetical protein